MKKKTNRKTKRVSEFKFESSSTPGKFYTVTVEGESYDCTCPGFVYRKKCSHLEKAKNQKHVEPADEEEMAKDTTPEKHRFHQAFYKSKIQRNNLFPNIEIDWDDWDAAQSHGGLDMYALSLADKISDESCRAAEMVGEIGDKSAVEPLIRLLNGEMKDHIYSIVSEIDDEFMDFCMVEETILAAANALGKIGDKCAIEPLIQALEKAQSSMQSEWSFRDALVKLGVVEKKLDPEEEEELEKTRKAEARAGQTGYHQRTEYNRARRFRLLKLARKAEIEKANLDATKANGVETNLVESNDNDWVSATKTRNYINKDPIVDWLDLYGDKLEYPRDTSGEKYDENLDFVKLLFRKGKKFEEKVIDYLKKEIGKKHFVTVAKDHLDSRYSTKQDETLQHMKSGVPFILQGVLRNSGNKTYGMPDIMVRSDWLSALPYTQENKDFQFLDESAKELGDYHYRIIDVKFTTLTYNADGQYLLGANAYKSQLAIYNMALGKLQGFKPPEAYLLGRNWKRTKAGTDFSGKGAFDKLGKVDFFNIDREHEKKSEEAADWIRKVRKDGSEWTKSDLRSHNIWPNCNNTYDYPWHNAKMQIANELDELTRVWQIGPKEREQSHNQRIYSWKDSRLTPEKMGIRGSVKSEIMREVLRINNQEKHKVLPSKISNNDRNWHEKQELEFFVDFETVSNIEDDFSQFPKQGGQELVFMIGCGYEKVFTAKNLCIEEEARIMTEWFDYMDRIKSEILGSDAELPNIFHWSPAELTFMGVAQNNFEGDEKKALEKIYKGKRRKMIKNWKDLPWFDFLKVMKDEPIVVKDAFGFGLKAIAI